jgi:hypothetical protein
MVLCSKYEVESFHERVASRSPALFLFIRLLVVGSRVERGEKFCGQVRALTSRPPTTC